MVLTPELFVSLLTALGLAGVLGAFFQSRFEHQKQVRDQEHELKRRRYGCILILMLTKLDPKTGVPHLREIRPDLKDSNDVEKEIEVELLNGVLFAGDDVIKSMTEFIRSPNHHSYIRAAIAMRKDLWGKKTLVDEKMFDVLQKGQAKSG